MYPSAVEPAPCRFAPDNDGADKDPEPGATTVTGLTGLTWTEGFVPPTPPPAQRDPCSDTIRPAHNFGGWISYFPDFPRNLGKS